MLSNGGGDPGGSVDVFSSKDIYISDACRSSLDVGDADGDYGFLSLWLIIMVGELERDLTIILE